MTQAAPHVQKLLMALRDYASAAREASLDGLVRLRLAETDLRAMRLLLAEPGMSSRDLASRLGISPTSTAVLLDRLMRRDLIRREVDAEGRPGGLFPTVALDEEPWSSLDRFDQRAGEIVADWPTETVADATALITAMRRGTEGTGDEG